MRGIRNKPETEGLDARKTVKQLKIGASPFKKLVIVKPFTGKEDLAEPVIVEEGKPLKLGSPMFFITGYPEKGFKLIMVYKKDFNGRTTVCRSLVKVIKPKKKNKPEERALMKRLRDLNIPGAY